MKLLAAAALGAVAVAASPAQRVETGEWTYGLASAGGSVWAGGLSLGDVVRVDPHTGKVTSRVNVGSRVFNLAVAPGAVWAVVNVTGTAVRLDTRTGKVTATVRVGGGPYDVEWGFGSAWVSNSSDGTVSRITGKKVVKTIHVGTEPNGLIAYRGSLFVTDHTAGKLVRIDPAANRITGTVGLAGADWATGYDGSLYVSQETNVVTRVDPRTLKVLGRVKVGRNPLGSAIVGHELWVPCIDAGIVSVVDPKTMRVSRTFAAGRGPIVVLPTAAGVWVSHSTGTDLWRYR
jgi:streptogramin lyase